MNTPTTTQIKRTTPLRAYPGWVVREYRNGMFDAAQVNGIGLTIGGHVAGTFHCKREGCACAVDPLERSAR